MTFYTDSAQRSRGAKIFAGAASDTEFLIDYRNFLRFRRSFRLRRIGIVNHRYCTRRAVAETVVARLFICIYDAKFFYPNRMSGLDRGFFFLCDFYYRAGRTYLRTFCTFWAAVTAFKRHHRLH